MRPRTRTSRPSEGRKRIRQFTPRKQVARNCAPSSRTVKYQCPEAAGRKFEISPSTQTDAKRFSIAPRTCEVNSDTESGLRSDSSNRDMRMGRDMVRRKDEGWSVKRQEGRKCGTR